MKTTTIQYILTAIVVTGFLSGCTTDQVTDKTTEAKCTVPSKYSNETTMTDENNPQLAQPKEGDTVVIIETECGTIKFKLFTAQAPEITKNFEELASTGKYNNVPFHRVIKDFMIQTGDFTNKNGTGGYSYKGPDTVLADEIAPDLQHLYGAVSMANRGPDTNGSQFFIVTNKAGTSHLDGGYTIFGQVYEGIAVAKTIQDLQVSGSDKPSKEINMTSVLVQQESAPV